MYVHVQSCINAYTSSSVWISESVSMRNSYWNFVSNGDICILEDHEIKVANSLV